MFSVTVTGICSPRSAQWSAFLLSSDIEDPVVDFCESPPEFITSTADVDIEWDEPVFHDNSKEEVIISQTHNFGFFPFGDTEVVYTAKDGSGNSAECRITIRLQSKLSSSYSLTGLSPHLRTLLCLA